MPVNRRKTLKYASAVRRVAGSLTLLLLAAGCAAGGGTNPLSTPDGSLAARSGAAHFLYVASSAGVSVYALGATVPLRTISKDVDMPAALAFDRSGNLYVANREGGPKGLGFISVFAPGSNARGRRISDGVNEPSSLAFDSRGNLYVANFTGALSPKPGGSITVYKPASAVPFRTITNGVDHPRQIVMANNDVLIAAVRSRVRVYPAGANTFVRTIRAINGALGLDSRNRLFVGNSQTCPNYCFANVDVYRPSKKDAIAHYSLSDLDWTGFLPTSYAFDSTGDVYMALSGGRWYLQGRVAVYPPLPRSPYHETYSLHGPEMTGPLALAVAPNDDLIVGNNGAVDVYAPRSQTLLFAITQGVGGQVTALAIQTQ